MALAESGDSLEKWLPLERSQLVRSLSEGSGIDRPTLQTLDEYVSDKRTALASNPEELKRFEKRWGETERRLKAEGTVWLLYDKMLPFWAVLAGRGEQLHSLVITVPVVNHSKEESKRAFTALSNLFEAIYPDWNEAEEWPGKSLQAAWENSPLVRKTPSDDHDSVFVRWANHGITSTTFGVPPDIVVYSITAREHCIPAHTQGNPFTRVIC